MSRLNQLYKAMQTLRSEGLALSEDLLEQVNELEENIIKNEILPVLRDTIEPALAPVQRNLVLLVEYSPQQPISVKLTRKRNFVNSLPDAKIIELDPIVEHSSNVISQKFITKSHATNLKIIFPDGHTIINQTATQTLQEFILYVGIEKVRKIGLTQCKIPLISNRIDEKNGNKQKPLGNGWYLMTNTSTITKKADIEKISSYYGLNVKVDIIKKIEFSTYYKNNNLAPLDFCRECRRFCA